MAVMKKLLSSLPRVLLTVLVFCLSQHCWLVTHHCWKGGVAHGAEVPEVPLAADHTERDLPEPHQHGRGPILAFVAQSYLHEKLYPLTPEGVRSPIFFSFDFASLDTALHRLRSLMVEALSLPTVGPFAGFVSLSACAQAPPDFG